MAYGTPYRKFTRVLTNMVELCSLQRECRHVRHTVQLSGQTRVFQDGKWIATNRTQLAGAYPQPLADAWASIVRRAIPDDAEKKCFTDSGRIEAGLKQAVEEKPIQHQWFLQRLTKQIPTLQQRIVYGQDSAAVKRQKRQRKNKAKAKLLKAWNNTKATFARSFNSAQSS